MRETSEFHLTCDSCQAAIVSRERDTRCEKCGALIRVIWPAELPVKKL